MKIAILDDYQNCVRGLGCFSLLAGHDVMILNDNIKDPQQLADRLADREAIVLTRERTRIGKELLSLLPKLRLISQTAKAGPHIDLQACADHNVTVLDGTGDGSSTAELTWALILASRRQLVPEANRLRTGKWQGFVGQQLRGQRLGVYGYGRIGSQIARYGKAFGMEIWAWGREGSAQRASQDGVAFAPSRAAFFSDSDVISVHLRLNDSTRGLISPADLDLMKTTALFVNTSRAELVQPDALEQALRNNRPGFAAVDVYESEPVLGARHPLLAMSNALCTPHIGFVERDNYEKYYGDAFKNVLFFIEKDALPT